MSVYNFGGFHDSSNRRSESRPAFTPHRAPPRVGELSLAMTVEGVTMTDR